MFEPTLYYPEINIPRVANGLFYLPSKSQHVYGHSGNSKAFSSSFYVDRKERIGVLVLTNIKDESTFTAGIPEIIFGEYEHGENEEKVENSSQWKGIYEPARLPRHGFSRVYVIFKKQDEAKWVTRFNGKRLEVFTARTRHLQNRRWIQYTQSGPLFTSSAN